ncbi:TPA: sugar phosphate isomerase/epimerase [Candidatus Bathyarchaeota archaeon]|nr:sugar phosphate isomerase/epimerase [Candidatus Bathyarchaeota archaeon]
MMGSSIVTTHPGRIPKDREEKTYKIIRDSISEIARYAEDVNAYFAIETGMEHPHVLKAFIEDVGSDGLGVNYDPANLLRYGVEEVVKGVRELGEWIVRTHAKDHNPETGRATVGEGLVPWERYLKELRNQGYSGWLALEDETGIDVINSLKKGRNFLRSLIPQI